MSTKLGEPHCAVSGGGKLPGRRPKDNENVLWLAGEESADCTIVPRLKAAGADLNRVYFLGCGPGGVMSAPLALPDQAPGLERRIVEHKAKLVVIDPLPCFVAPGLDLNKFLDMNRVMTRLALIARNTGCAIIALRNLTKKTSGPAINQGVGSSAIAASARIVLRAGRHPHRNQQHVLWVVECNIAEKAPTLGYDLISSGGIGLVRWGSIVPLSADELEAEPGDGGERDAQADARRLLKAALQDGPRKYAELKAEALQAGVSEATLRRAKERLGVRSRRVGFGKEGQWEWLPPEAGWPPDLA